jgi:ADP-ribosylglycohydrolase
MGFTTRTALSELYKKKDGIHVGPEKTIHTVLENNQRSESNGCLMRITPLAVFAHKLDSIE